jgi:hypothetical protein
MLILGGKYGKRVFDDIAGVQDHVVKGVLEKSILAI